MRTVNIHEAKPQFSKLIEAVVPVPKQDPARKPGAMKGEIRVADDFDAPLPAALQAEFEGR